MAYLAEGRIDMRYVSGHTSTKRLQQVIKARIMTQPLQPCWRELKRMFGMSKHKSVWLLCLALMLEIIAIGVLVPGD